MIQFGLFSSAKALFDLLFSQQASFSLRISSFDLKDMMAAVENKVKQLLRENENTALCLLTKLIRET